MGFYGLDNFIGWSSTVLKNPPSNTRDVGLIRGSRRSSGEGKGSPLQYSYLGNPMDRGAWWATVQRVTRVGHDLRTKQQQKPYIQM